MKLTNNGYVILMKTKSSIEGTDPKKGVATLAHA